MAESSHTKRPPLHTEMPVEDNQQENNQPVPKSAPSSGLNQLHRSTTDTNHETQPKPESRPTYEHHRRPTMDFNYGGQPGAYSNLGADYNLRYTTLLPPTSLVEHNEQQPSATIMIPDMSRSALHSESVPEQNGQRRLQNVAMPDSDRTSGATSLHNPFGYILPPDTDASLPQGNPILDHTNSDILNDWFNDPDRNSSLALQIPDMMPFANNTDLNFALDFDAFNSSHPPFDEQPQIANNYSQALQQPNQSNNSNGNGNGNVASYYARHTSTNLTNQPSDHVLNDFGIGGDAPEEVIRAAAKLFEYRSQRQASTMQTQASDFTFRSSHDSNLMQTSHVPMTVPSRNYASPQTYPQTNGNFRASLGTNPAYSPPTSMSAPQRRSYAEGQSYQFASDRNFTSRGYQGPQQQSGEEGPFSLFHGIVPYGDSAVPSAASSHPQSPVATRHDPQHPGSYSFPRPLMKQEGSIEASDRKNPRKRRRTMATAAEEQPTRHDLHTEASSVTNNQSSPDANDLTLNADNDSSPESAEDEMPSNPRKRRKSSSAAQTKTSAAARKNLTEEQKRENHIKSEQKRRNIIKDGYKNLNELVPNLKQGGFSKSATLTETVRELETLQEANSSWRSSIQEALGLTSAELQAMMDSM